MWLLLPESKDRQRAMRIDNLDYLCTDEKFVDGIAVLRRGIFYDTPREERRPLLYFNTMEEVNESFRNLFRAWEAHKRYHICLVPVGVEWLTLGEIEKRKEKQIP